MDFGVILGDIHIIKMLKLQTSFPPGRNFHEASATGHLGAVVDSPDCPMAVKLVGLG